MTAQPSPDIVVVAKFQNPSSKFAKAEERLSERAKKNLDKAIKTLMSTGMSLKSKNFEPVENHDSMYSVRLGDKVRFIFKLAEDGTAKAISIGNHDNYKAISIEIMITTKGCPSRREETA